MTKKMSEKDFKGLFDNGGTESVPGDPNKRTKATAKNHIHTVGKTAKPSTGRTIRVMREESKHRSRLEKETKKGVLTRHKLKVKESGLNRAGRRELYKDQLGKLKKKRISAKPKNIGNRVPCIEGCGRMVIDQGKRTCRKCRRVNEIRLLRLAR